MAPILGLGLFVLGLVMLFIGGLLLVSFWYDPTGSLLIWGPIILILIGFLFVIAGGYILYTAK